MNKAETNIYQWAQRNKINSKGKYVNFSDYIGRYLFLF